MSIGKNGERFVWLLIAIQRGAYRDTEGEVVSVFESSTSANAMLASKRKHALSSHYIVQRRTVKP